MINAPAIYIDGREEIKKIDCFIPLPEVNNPNGIVNDKFNLLGAGKDKIPANIINRARDIFSAQLKNAEAKLQQMRLANPDWWKPLYENGIDCDAVFKEEMSRVSSIQSKSLGIIQAQWIEKYDWIEDEIGQLERVDCSYIDFSGVPEGFLIRDKAPQQDEYYLIEVSNGEKYYACKAYYVAGAKIFFSEEEAQKENVSYEVFPVTRDELEHRLIIQIRQLSDGWYGD